MTQPDLIAYADQRIASAAEFVNSMVGSLRDVNACITGSDSALDTLALSDLLLACYRRNGSHPETTCDALALALRRLAAK